LALKLLGGTAPMVSMAVIHRFLRKFRPPEQAIVVEGH
jgi:hypothetical protein